MRHRLGLRKLNRTSSHRLAMLRNMTNSLLRHEAIKTTVPKAKELRRVAEPIITLGKKPTLANRRLAFSRLRDREMVSKLFDELGPRFAQRNGGYLRILKFGFREGDNAPMALVELMDRPEGAGQTQGGGRRQVLICVDARESKRPAQAGLFVCTTTSRAAGYWQSPNALRQPFSTSCRTADHARQPQPPVCRTGIPAPDHNRAAAKTRAAPQFQRLPPRPPA